MIRKSMTSRDAQTQDTTAQDMEKVNRYTKKTLTAEEIYTFSLLLCDNDVDRDFECFPLQTLQQLQKKFPGVTGLFDHNTKSQNQHARIFDTWLEAKPEKTTAAGEPYYCVRAKAYLPRTDQNRALMQEIDAGIKKEVSVGCAVEKTLCSVCGTNVQKSSCRHVPGQTYAGKQCHRLLCGAKDAYEWSFVAVPAQRAAGVVKQFLDKEGGQMKMDDVMKALEGAQQELVLTKAQAQRLHAQIQEMQADAQAGRIYRADLCKEINGLCALTLPRMDAGVFSSVSKTMDVEALKSFRKAFLGESDTRPAGSQLGTQTHAFPAKDYDAFKI